MNPPFISLLFKSTYNTISRFAIPIFFAAFGTGIVIAQIEILNLSNETRALLIRLLLTCVLGLPLTTAWKIMAEMRNFTTAWKVISLGMAMALLFIFYVSLGTDPDYSIDSYGYRFVAWNLTFHLVVSFAAFSAYSQLNGFWQYNKHLFIRFLTAALYSSVLYLGIAGAMLAVQELFNADIDANSYFDLWVIIAGVFNTLFFFGGLPENMHEFKEQTDYPKGLKLFTQYILVPLVSLYLIILYAYLLKITVLMQLPKGWVSILILIFSIVGIFSILLVHPVRNLAENKWINMFSRFFYFSLLPLVCMLFIAIGRRITDYGITVDRFIVAMLGVWLLFVSLYFIFSKKKNIILIPVSLALLFFLTSFGPWGAFGVSEKSQLRRLLTLFEKTGVIQEGKIIKLDDAQTKLLPKEDVDQIYSILNYLDMFHDLNGLKPYLVDSTCLAEVNLDDNKMKLDVNGIAKCTGIPNEYGFDLTTDAKNYDFSIADVLREEGVVVTGYDAIFEFYNYDIADAEQSPDKQIAFQSILKTKTKLSFYVKGNLALDLDLKSMCNALIEHDKFQSDKPLAPEQFTFVNATKGGNIKVIFKKISFYKTNNSLNLNNIEGYFLIKNMN